MAEHLLFDIVTHSPEETLEFGCRLAAELRAPSWVLLSGELGSGKTTLAKGIVVGLGAASPEDVTSPSFTLVHEYGVGIRVYHVDLYRVEDTRELATLGLGDFLAQNATTIIEWGERLGDQLPLPCMVIELEYGSGEERRIRVKRLE